MEEVDSILISQLKEIGCDFDDDDLETSSILSFDSNQIMKCVSICLRKIYENVNNCDDGDNNDLAAIPDPASINSMMNMSVKYKLANQLCTCIQKIGYKSDIGYQTFLYSNEHEIRRLLLFLIEKISTDTDDSKSTISDQSMKNKWSIKSDDILKRLKHLHLSTVWIPHSSDDIFNEDDVDSEDGDEDDDDIKYCSESDYFDCYSMNINSNSVHGMNNINIKSLKSLINADNVLIKKYFQSNISNHNQMSIIPEKIIDILEWNNHYWKRDIHDDDNLDYYVNHYLQNISNSNLITINGEIDIVANETIIDSQPSIENNVSSLVDQKLIKSSNNVDDENAQHEKKNKHQIIIDELQQELDDCEKQIADCKLKEQKLKELESDYQEKYKQFESSLKSKEELEANIQKLKESIEEIGVAWDELQKDLLEQLNTKKQKYSEQNELHIEKIRTLNALKKSIAMKTKEMQSKESMINELESKQPQQWPPGRKSYTRRIIEIIQNVKKQNDETLKVVSETKTIQKDINNLYGKIERSFTVADEVFFRDARQNEWNRNCYKSLAMLQSTFTELLNAINEIGVNLREIRKLEEMIENETNRKTSSNLTRINADLEQIRSENKQLRQKIRDVSSSSSSTITI